MFARGLKSVFNMQQDTHFSYVSRLGKILVTISVVSGIFFIIMSADPIAYRRMIAEDGVIEYGSALMWFFSALVLSLTFLMTKTKTTIFIVAHILLIAFFIVCAGEEISWGQRIYGFEVPKGLIAINVQNEATLHNIGSTSIFSNAFFLLTIGFFIVYPMLFLRNHKVRPLVIGNDLQVVVYYSIVTYLVIFVVWIIIGLRFGTLGFHPYSVWDYYNQMDDEIFEFFAAYSFLVFSILNHAYKNKQGQFKLDKSVGHRKVMQSSH